MFSNIRANWNTFSTAHVFLKEPFCMCLKLDMFMYSRPAVQMWYVHLLYFNFNTSNIPSLYKSWCHLAAAVTVHRFFSVVQHAHGWICSDVPQLYVCYPNHFLLLQLIPLKIFLSPHSSPVSLWEGFFGDSSIHQPTSGTGGRCAAFSHANVCK